MRFIFLIQSWAKNLLVDKSKTFFSIYLKIQAKLNLIIEKQAQSNY